MKEINFDQLVEDLGQYQINLTTMLNSNSLFEHNRLIVKLLENHWSDSYDHQIIRTKGIEHRGYARTNQSYLCQNEWTDVTILEFSSLYSSIYADAIRNDKLHFNYTDYAKLYLYIYDNRLKIKESGNKTAYWNAKTIINCLHGILHSKKWQFLYSDMKTSITTEFLYENIAKQLESSYYGLISGNTDQYYFDLSHEFHNSMFLLFVDNLKEKFPFLNLEYRLLEKINFFEITDNSYIRKQFEKAHYSRKKFPDNSGKSLL